MTTSEDRMQCFTAADWKPLVASGAASVTKSGSRKAEYELDYGNIDDMVARKLMDEHTVDSVEQFRTDAMIIEDIVWGVLGLPNTVRERPATIDPRDWYDPTETLCTVVKSRLNVQYTGKIQKRVMDKGLILVNGDKEVDVPTPAGFTSRKTYTAYAVTNVAEVVREYTADPQVKATLKADARKIKHNRALIDAVPEAAAVLIASLDVMATSAITRRRAVYDHAILGMSPDAVAALDARIAGEVTHSEVGHGSELRALTGGSPETPEGEQV